MLRKIANLLQGSPLNASHLGEVAARRLTALFGVRLSYHLRRSQDPVAGGWMEIWDEDVRVARLDYVDGGGTTRTAAGVANVDIGAGVAADEVGLATAVESALTLLAAEDGLPFTWVRSAGHLRITADQWSPLLRISQSASALQVTAPEV